MMRAAVGLLLVWGMVSCDEGRASASTLSDQTPSRQLNCPMCNPVSSSIVTLTCDFTNLQFGITLDSPLQTLNPELTVLNPLEAGKLMGMREITRLEVEDKAGCDTNIDGRVIYTNIGPNPSFSTVSFTNPAHATLSIDQDGVVTYSARVKLIERVLDVDSACAYYQSITQEINLACHALPLPTQEDVLKPPTVQECDLTDCENYFPFTCNCIVENGMAEVTVTPSGLLLNRVSWELVGLGIAPVTTPAAVDFHEIYALASRLAECPVAQPPQRMPPQSVVTRFPYVEFPDTAHGLAAQCQVRYCTPQGQPTVQGLAVCDSAPVPATCSAG